MTKRSCCEQVIIGRAHDNAVRPTFIPSPPETAGEAVVVLADCGRPCTDEPAVQCRHTGRPHRQPHRAAPGPGTDDPGPGGNHRPSGTDHDGSPIKAALRASAAQYPCGGGLARDPRPRDDDCCPRTAQPAARYRHIVQRGLLPQHGRQLHTEARTSTRSTARRYRTLCRWHVQLQPTPARDMFSPRWCCGMAVTIHGRVQYCGDCRPVNE